MGIFDRFPYSSTHEMNLDFMLGKATEIAEDMQTVTTGMAQVQAGLSAISEKTEQATQAAAQAAQSASSIEGSVTAAEEAAEEAQMHNESAQTWANNAMTYKADCQRSATEAAASATSAAQAATAAAGSEDTVAQYAQAANASAQSAANNNDSAHQYANQASASASNATFHSSNAQTAATNANTSATNAETAATNAQTAATRTAALKDDCETLHRMCAAAVDQAATEAVNAANSAAQAAATKTDVENLVESLPEDFTDLNNTVNQLSDDIVDIVNVKSADQNVLSPDNFTLAGFISSTDGISFTSNTNYICTNDFINVPFGTQNMTAVFPQTENNDRICCFLYYDEEGNYTGSYSGRFNGYNYKMATLDGTISVAKIKFWVNKTTVPDGGNGVCISFSATQSFQQYEEVKKVANNALETPEIYLPFVGKTIVNFGDSIFGNKHQPFSISYALESLTGATVYNCGFGGTDMAARSSATWDAFSMYRLAYAIANNDFSLQDTAIEDTTAGLLSYFPSTLSLLKSINFNDVDIITIAFGTNDFTGNIVLDNESDPDDTTKFCGALRYSLDQIMAAFPHVKIFVCGQTYRFWMDSSNVFIDDSNTHENGNGDKLTDFVAATKSVSDEYHVPFIDNYNIGINKINRGYYFPANDGTHQNYLGAELIAEHIKHELY